jgi:hypothetical protein
MPHAHCMLGTETRIQTHTNTTFNILIAFPRQRFLLKAPQCLRSTYMTCVVTDFVCITYMICIKFRATRFYLFGI